MKCDNWWMIKKKGLKPFFLKYNIIKNSPYYWTLTKKDCYNIIIGSSME